MSDIQTWSTTAASNNATPPNGFPEGMAPSTVNDAAREVMAAVARYRSDTDGVNTSSGTNTITLAASRTMTDYNQGDMYTFKAGGTNTGATTLNVDSLGAKDVQFNGAACTGGEIVSGLMYTVVYDGTQFQLMNAASYPAIDITTLEVTNIKAKDGTASMTIANSTGQITASAQFNATTIDTTNIEVTNIKAKDGAASLVISDSTGNVSASGSFYAAGALSTSSTVTASGEISSADGFLITGTIPATGSSDAFYKIGATVLGGSSVTNINYESKLNYTLGSVASSYNFLAKGIVLTTATATNQYGFFTDNTFTAATNNYGFYSDIASGTGRWNFYSNGTATNYFGGNTIVSVTDNTNAALRVTQTGTANALEIEDSANPDSTPVVIDALGNLIVGATTIQTAASYVSGSAISVHNVNISHAPRAGVSAYAWYPGAQQACYFGLHHSRGTSVGDYAALISGDVMGRIDFSGADGTEFVRGASILATVDGTPGTGDMPGRLGFFTTTDGTSSLTEQFRINNAGNALVIGAGGLGYGTGSGGAVTQATSRTTGVTLNKTNGAITLVSAAGSATWQSFTVTNSTVAATDVVILSQKSGADLYMLSVTAVAAGSFRISFATTGGTTTEQPVLNFAVIKAVTA